MQNIEIKSGTSSTISITPKINGAPAPPPPPAGVTIYVFFVHQFTNKIYGSPYVLNANNLTINLTPATTIDMLGNAEENQKFVLQFAIKNSIGDVIAEEKESSIAINI
jgi:uncharacterized protein YlzI (FlbEa/FlbD family)